MFLCEWSADGEHRQLFSNKLAKSISVDSFYTIDNKEVFLKHPYSSVACVVNQFYGKFRFYCCIDKMKSQVL